MINMKPPKEMTDDIEWKCPDNRCFNVNTQTIFVGMPEQLICNKCKRKYDIKLKK